jgi:glycerophosphoryl diester phosphodiesterase
LAYQVPVAQSGVPVVTPRFIAAAHAQGVEVHVWTVDEEEDVELCVNLGVEAIISNKPREVRALLGEIN